MNNIRQPNFTKPFPSVISSSLRHLSSLCFHLLVKSSRPSLFCLRFFSFSPSTNTNQDYPFENNSWKLKYTFQPLALKLYSLLFFFSLSCSRLSVVLRSTHRWRQRTRKRPLAFFQNGQTVSDWTSADGFKSHGAGRPLFLLSVSSDFLLSFRLVIFIFLFIGPLVTYSVFLLILPSRTKVIITTVNFIVFKF